MNKQNAYDNLAYLQNTMHSEARDYGPSRAGRLMNGCAEAIKRERELLRSDYQEMAINRAIIERLNSSRLYRILKKAKLLP